MRGLWWKILGLLLVFYALTISLLAPLHPGLLQANFDTIAPGANRGEVVGYNTHFLEAGDALQATVHCGKNEYCTEIIEVLSDTRAIVEVECPEKIPFSLLDIYLNSPIDGTVYLPNGLHASQEMVNPNTGVSECPISVENDAAPGFGFPFLPTIFETIRNLMWHVPMWFTMFFLMIMSVVQSIRFLGSGKLSLDHSAANSAKVGIVFCILGLVTGSIWAKFTWGAWWVDDPQLNGAMVTFLIYVAYLILRRSIEDEEKKGRISAVYNIFAFVMLVVLLMILPKFTESLHPGKGGTPAFSSYDLDSSLRPVFYPAVVGWIIVGYWIYSLKQRLKRIENTLDYGE
jgi:heme exporter protein C